MEMKSCTQPQFGFRIKWSSRTAEEADPLLPSHQMRPVGMFEMIPGEDGSYYYPEGI